MKKKKRRTIRRKAKRSVARLAQREARQREARQKNEKNQPFLKYLRGFDVIEIPFADTPNQSFSIPVFGGNIDVTLRFNIVRNRWVSSVFINGVALSEGNVVLLGTNLIPPNLKHGRLLAVNHHSDVQPSRENVIVERTAGDRDIYLYYLTEAEYASAL